MVWPPITPIKCETPIAAVVTISKNKESTNAKPIASRNIVEAPKTMYLASPKRPTFLPKKSANTIGKSAYTAPSTPICAGVAPISIAR